MTPCTSWPSLCLSMVSEDSELRRQEGSFRQNVEIPVFDLSCLDDVSVDERCSKKPELSTTGSDHVEECARKDDARMESAAFAELSSESGEAFRGNRKRPRSVIEEDAVQSAKRRKTVTVRVALSEILSNTASSMTCRKRKRPPSGMTEEEAFRSAKHRRKDTAGSTGRKRKIGKGLRKAGKWIRTQLIHAGPVLAGLRGLAPGGGWGRCR